ncbi:SAM-dependent methyltransferase [Tropicimonas sp. TH_r6]|uniref:class I SAM-dependent methyltransferase n=1 Tax=Tropicimonas sp. TH_r6 TaxID=3082085 RepID=UPI002952CF66|nr:SAM-dependent methyltransferase [Tropicimonas sp. TH_r6]MDV7142241.1 SAM-dependent methyltransferase [Tropicimonas sp. TH_r6]
MTPLADILHKRIALTGPLTLADYMAECLLHPEHGYYTTAPVFGAAGDFVTAPEISQMFGELLGLALAQGWLDQGAPHGAVLAEAGPGRGTLMADMLRAMRPIPGLPDAFDIRLIEASARLRDLQRDAVSPYPAQWMNRIGDLPDAPLYFIANEFLDALPIRQFQRAADGWREHVIFSEEGAFRSSFAAPVPVPDLDYRLADTHPGEIVELCPALPALVTELAERIARNGGMAVFIDYGNWRSRGDTLQALQEHAPVDPFKSPGRADLTAHVDFEAIARAAASAGAATSSLIAQGVLLERLGITQRAQALARAMPDSAALENHIAAHRRLTHPQEMGSLFKAIAIHPDGTAPPPGFET